LLEAKFYKPVVKTLTFMKIPKTFVKENISDKELERILSLDKYNNIFNKRIDHLLSGCEEFLHSAAGIPEFKYKLGEKIASNYVYNIEDLENLSMRILLEQPWSCADNLGFYFSALINKIMKNDCTIKITTSTNFDGLGMYLEKGNLIISDNAGSFTGKGVTGEKMMILGDVKDYLAYEMKDGIIVVEGKVGECVGYQATSGELFLNELESNIARSCEAKVFKKGVKIWPLYHRTFGIIDII